MGITRHHIEITCTSDENHMRSTWAPHAHHIGTTCLSVAKNAASTNNK